MDKIEKIKKEVLDSLNQGKDEEQLSRITHNALGIGYVKFKKIVVSHAKNPLLAKIEIFRKTVNFMEYLYDELIQLEKELSEAGVEYYFPNDNEYVETVEIEGKKTTVLKKIDTIFLWKKTALQTAIERDNKPITGLK